jgi:hypothetical protein
MTISKWKLTGQAQPSTILATEQRYYARENLQMLSVELIREYMHETILPKMI